MIAVMSEATNHSLSPSPTTRGALSRAPISSAGSLGLGLGDQAVPLALDLGQAGVDARFQDRAPGRVVTAVLEALQPIHEDGRRLLVSQVSDDSAHRRSRSNSAYEKENGIPREEVTARPLPALPTKWGGVVPPLR